MTWRELAALVWAKYGRAILWVVLAVSSSAGTIGYACLRAELAAERSADAGGP